MCACVSVCVCVCVSVCVCVAVCVAVCVCVRASDSIVRVSVAVVCRGSMNMSTLLKKTILAAEL